MPTAPEKSPAAAAAAGDYATLRELYRPHIESFDYFLDEGLDKMLLSIRPMEITDPSSNATLRMSLEKGHVLPPMKDGRLEQPLYPQECRQGRISYSGEFKVEAFFQFNDGAPIRQTLNFGYLPIMLMSKLCHLRGADSRKLIYHGEEATEMGGYFISGGMERLIRILIIQKRNYPMSMVRSSFVKRGEGYTDKAVVIRCVQLDQSSSVTVKLYYLQNGSARLGFWFGGREVLLPVGIVLKTECIDLSSKRRENVPEVFAKSRLSRDTSDVIDSDGLPRVGEAVVPNEQYYSVYNTLTGAIRPVRLKGTEPATIDYVAVNGTNSKGFLEKVNIRLRRKRNPIIGDKFSSRHGQKGVCSQLWPDIDMPFSEHTGMRPDLIINPHAFPSRMTIAMLIQSIAAKVRTTGRIDQVTRQPIGGRKHGGGIRFGEMERDALLAYGASYLLHDRLHTCSDYHIADACSLCGSLLTATVIKSETQKKSKRNMLGVNTLKPPKNFACQACQTNKGMETVAMPYVFRYLAAELAAMNIKLDLRLSYRRGSPPGNES